MKNVFKIFIRDMKKMIFNPFALLILCGLIILPSLYAWLNIEASWNPYDRTSHIQIAVSNNDVGATFSDLSVNVGDDVEAELKANDEIDWVFLSEEEVREGVENGKYYAGVIIPEDFSKDFLSITTDTITKPTIEYIVNDKMNAIAPKITDAGVTTLHTEINEKFIETISEQLLIITKKIDEAITENNAIDDTITFLEDTSANLEDLILILESAISLNEPISKGTDLIDDSVTHLQEVISNTSESIDSGQESIKETEKLNDAIIDSISIQFNTLESDLNILVGDIDEIINSLKKSEEITVSDLEFISEKLSSLITTIETIANDIKDINEKLIIPLSGLDDVYNDLISTANIFKNINNEIINAEKNISSSKLETLLTKVKNSINNEISTLSMIKSNYVTTISPAIAKFESDIEWSLEEVKTSLTSADAGIDYIKQTIDSTDSIISASTESLNNIKDLVENNKKQIDDSIKMIKTQINQSEIQVLVDTITKNPTLASDFFANPIEVNEVKLYEMANYGSAMTPFYLVLCLWVGSMFLMSVLKTTVKEDNKINNIKRRQAYFGRGLTYMVIAIVQGIVASVGGLLFLNITAANPVAFVLMCVFTSIVFSAIIYGLVAGLGNIGKALTIVLLVVQVAGAGGTFPVELTPDIFGKLNPFMPFTYAINAVRETVGGITTEALMRDILILSLFIPIGIIIGLLLNKKFGKLNLYIDKKMEETDIMI